MTKRIVYLSISVVMLAVTGLIAARNFFASFPPPGTVIERLAPSENVTAAADMTESFFDDSGSMRSYYGEQYVKFLRIIKSHIREKGQYKYFAFSEPEKIIEGDVWEAVEDVRFYNRNDTSFDKVLDSISVSVTGGDKRARNYLIITDGIQDVSGIHDYSRITDKVADLLDAGLSFQIIAIQLPFSGYKYPEGGGVISYKGDSPLFCYIFSYQNDFGRDLYKKLSALDLPVGFLESGSGNIDASVKQFIVTAKNQDGSENTFKRFKDELPVTYLLSRSGTGGTLLTKIGLAVNGRDLDFNSFSEKAPEFCGKCLPIGDSGDLPASIPDVKVAGAGPEPLPDADGNIEIEYSLFFRGPEQRAKTVACDLTLCNWLPVNTPEWVSSWSSDCDNSSECFQGKTPFLKNIITPIMNRSVRKHTFGYAVIKKW